MKRGHLAGGGVVLLAGGLTAAVALGAGTSKPATKTAATTTRSSAPTKVFVCHHTGSSKRPYHLITVSSHALPAHMRHGDALPAANNACPATQPAGAKTHGHGKKSSEKAKADDKDDTTTTDD